MCTLIVGRDLLAPGTLLLAANRDEDPARPSDPPGVLHEAPRVVGGRDRVAGGTWLAVREGHAVVGMLNRRPGHLDPGGGERRGGATPSATPTLRSRGLLALEIASLAAPDREAFAAAALEHARGALRDARYAPFSLAILTADTASVMTQEDGGVRVNEVPPGWHVLTHTDLDDPHEPRAARLAQELAGFAPASLDEAFAGLAARLSEHATGDQPAVCIHEGRMVTVSASIVFLGPTGASYRHAEGRPCERPFRDHGTPRGDSQ